MLDFRTLNEELPGDVSVPERRMLVDFLRISMHPTSAPSAVESRILTSLALALRSTQTAV